MEEYIEKTNQKIRELNKIVNVKEWNKIAKEENLLSTKTLSAIFGVSFQEHCINLRKAR